MLVELVNNSYGSNVPFIDLMQSQLFVSSGQTCG
jgi:hypothetical protein